MFGTRGGASRIVSTSTPANKQVGPTPTATRLAEISDPLSHLSDSRLGRLAASGRTLTGQFVRTQGTQAKERMEMNDEIHGTRLEEDEEELELDQEHFKERLDLSSTTPDILPKQGTPNTFGSTTPSYRTLMVPPGTLAREKGKSLESFRTREYPFADQHMDKATEDVPTSKSNRPSTTSPTPSEEEAYRRSPDHTFYVDPRGRGSSHRRPIILPSSLQLGAGSSLALGGGSASSSTITTRTTKTHHVYHGDSPRRELSPDSIPDLDERSGGSRVEHDGVPDMVEDSEAEEEEERIRQAEDMLRAAREVARQRRHLKDTKALQAQKMKEIADNVARNERDRWIGGLSDEEEAVAARPPRQRAVAPRSSNGVGRMSLEARDAAYAEQLLVEERERQIEEDRLVAVRLLELETETRNEIRERLTREREEAAAEAAARRAILLPEAPVSSTGSLRPARAPVGEYSSASSAEEGPAPRRGTKADLALRLKETTLSMVGLENDIAYWKAKALANLPEGQMDALGRNEDDPDPRLQRSPVRPDPPADRTSATAPRGLGPTRAPMSAGTFSVPAMCMHDSGTVPQKYSPSRSGHITGPIGNWDTRHHSGVRHKLTRGTGPPPDDNGDPDPPSDDSDDSGTASQASRASGRNPQRPRGVRPSGHPPGPGPYRGPPDEDHDERSLRSLTYSQSSAAPLESDTELRAAVFEKIRRDYMTHSGRPRDHYSLRQDAEDEEGLLVVTTDYAVYGLKYQASKAQGRRWGMEATVKPSIGSLFGLSPARRANTGVYNALQCREFLRESAQALDDSYRCLLENTRDEEDKKGALMCLLQRDRVINFDEWVHEFFTAHNLYPATGTDLCSNPTHITTYFTFWVWFHCYFTRWVYRCYHTEGLTWAEVEGVINGLTHNLQDQANMYILPEIEKNVTVQVLAQAFHTFWYSCSGCSDAGTPNLVCPSTKCHPTTTNSGSAAQSLWNKESQLHYAATAAANKKLSTPQSMDKKEIIRLYELTHPKPAAVPAASGGAMTIGSALRKQNLIPLKKAVTLRLTPTV